MGQMTLITWIPKKVNKNARHSKQNLSHTWSNKWSELVAIGQKLFLVKITQQVINNKGKLLVTWPTLTNRCWTNLTKINQLRAEGVTINFGRGSASL